MIISRTSNEIEIQCDRTRALYVSAYFILPGMIAVVIWVISGASLLFLWGGSLFVIGGIFVLFSANRLRSVFNKNSGAIIEKTLIVSRKTATRNIAPADIAGVHYYTSYKTAKDAQFRDASAVSIVLRKGNKVVVDEQSAFSQKTFIQTCSHSAAVDSLESEAKTLAEFLNVPLSVTDLSSLRPFARRS